MASLFGTTDPNADELGEREPGRWGKTCRKCKRPVGLHCPGCGACWPLESCALLCDGSEHDGWMELVMRLIDEWVEEHGA